MLLSICVNRASSRGRPAKSVYKKTNEAARKKPWPPVQCACRNAALRSAARLTSRTATSSHPSTDVWVRKTTVSRASGRVHPPRGHEDGGRAARHGWRDPHPRARAPGSAGGRWDPRAEDERWMVAAPGPGSLSLFLFRGPGWRVGLLPGLFILFYFWRRSWFLLLTNI